MNKTWNSVTIWLVVFGLIASGCSVLDANTTDNALGDDPTSLVADQVQTGSTTSEPNSSTSSVSADSENAGEATDLASEVDIQDLIERILITYTEAINDREPEEAYGLFTEELQQRVPLEELVDGTSTSFISRLNVSQVILQNPEDSGDPAQLGRSATVFASFRTDQDPAFGRQEQPCSWWEMEYRLEELGEEWLIDSAAALGGSPIPCPIVAEQEPVDVPLPTLPGDPEPNEPESEPSPDQSPGGKPVVHLTLDDGPGPQTPLFLSLFEEYDVKATFFVNSNKIGGREDVTRQIVDAGHAIANHTHTHCNIMNPAKLTPVSQCGNRTAQSEIGDAQDIVASTTGVTPKCFRPPFGAQSEATLQVIADFGLANWLWDIDTNDWQFNARNKNYTDEQAVAELNRASTVKPSGPSEGVVILLHDGTASAPRMLKLLRSWLEQNADAYEFKQLTGC